MLDYANNKPVSYVPVDLIFIIIHRIYDWCSELQRHQIHHSDRWL